MRSTFRKVEAVYFICRSSGPEYDLIHKLRPTKDGAEVHVVVEVEKETMKHLVLAAIISLALCGSGWAKDDKGNYIILGAGTLSCGGWLEKRAKGGWESRLLLEWFHGYISSHNEYVEGVANVIEGVGIDSINAWIDGHCQNHPLDDLHIAAEALIDHFESQQLSQ